jgi:hypothetical protein
MGVIALEELFKLQREAVKHNDFALNSVVSMIRVSNEDPHLLSKLLLQVATHLCRSNRELQESYRDLIMRVPTIHVIKEKP